MKSSIAVFAFLFIILLSTSARNFTTVSYGYWEDGATWLGGTAPDTLIAGDTIIIKHPVIFQHDLSFSKQSLLQVDSTGGAICGHKNIKVYNGARLISYGLVEADSLIIPGGSVLLYLPGSLIITNEVKMTVSGAVFKNNGSAVAVGPWFNCHLPEYQIFSGIGTAHPGNLKITVIPDPGRGIFYRGGKGVNAYGKNYSNGRCIDL